MGVKGYLLELKRHLFKLPYLEIWEPRLEIFDNAYTEDAISQSHQSLHILLASRLNLYVASDIKLMKCMNNLSYI